MVTPADDLQQKIEQKEEETVDSLDSSIDAELDKAAESKEWPVKYNMSEYDADVRRKTEARISNAKYKTGWEGDYLVVHKPG